MTISARLPVRLGLAGLLLAVASLPVAAQTAAPAAPPAATSPAAPTGATAAPAPATTKIVLDRYGMPEKFSGEQIRQTWFDGQPFLATGPDGTAYRMVFTPDGKATRTPTTGKKPKTTGGFWRVIAEGYCSRWAGNNREKCFNVRKSEDGLETIVRFGQQIAARWSRP